MCTQILTGFSTLGHYEETVYDDIADSITYANHYLAPIRAPVTEVAQALLAYSQYNHKRADLFVTLSRYVVTSMSLPDARTLLARGNT